MLQAPGSSVTRDEIEKFHAQVLKEAGCGRHGHALEPINVTRDFSIHGFEGKAATARDDFTLKFSIGLSDELGVPGRGTGKKVSRAPEDV